MAITHCKKHPAYKAERQPQARCYDCWRAWWIELCLRADKADATCQEITNELNKRLRRRLHG